MIPASRKIKKKVRWLEEEKESLTTTTEAAIKRGGNSTKVLGSILRKQNTKTC